jgi:hypothetical protein
MESRILILFVHGFLGSESSFCSFPLDLVQLLRQRYHLARIEARVFPFFDTKGDPEKAINMLYNWLLLNACAPEYEGVVLCGFEVALTSVIPWVVLFPQMLFASF